MPCTTILVGKDASYDGSTIIARNEYSGSLGFCPKRPSGWRSSSRPTSPGTTAAS